VISGTVSAMSFTAARRSPPNVTGVWPAMGPPESDLFLHERGASAPYGGTVCTFVGRIGFTVLYVCRSQSVVQRITQYYS
jgi:hypothetical protein